MTVSNFNNYKRLLWVSNKTLRLVRIIVVWHLLVLYCTGWMIRQYVSKSGIILTLWICHLWKEMSLPRSLRGLWIIVCWFNNTFNSFLLLFNKYDLQFKHHFFQFSNLFHVYTFVIFVNNKCCFFCLLPCTKKVYKEYEQCFLQKKNLDVY